MDLRRLRPLLLAVSVAACSGGGPPPKPSVAIATLERQAGMTGCRPAVVPLTAATATCTYGSGDVTLSTFATSGNRDLWVSASRATSGGITVVGDGWAATLLDQDDARSLATLLGGHPT